MAVTHTIHPLRVLLSEERDEPVDHLRVVLAVSDQVLYQLLLQLSLLCDLCCQKNSLNHKTSACVLF